jgi:hypothetical protein
MAMAEAAVGDVTTAPTFALEAALPGSATLPPNTTLSAFAVRRDGGDTAEDGLFIFVTSLNAAKDQDLPTLALSLEIPKSLLPAPLVGLQLHEFRMGASRLLPLTLFAVVACAAEYCSLCRRSCLIDVLWECRCEFVHIRCRARGAEPPERQLAAAAAAMG